MKLYNTLTKTVEDFVPFNGDKVNMFACGPTVYDFAHIGNGRTAITMDVLARLLRYLNFNIFYLVNITDIDDKIINRAIEQKISWQDLSKKYEDQYINDMHKLGIKIDQYARATDYINDIKKQVTILMDKGHAYKINDGIYFEISTFKDYGKLSGRHDIEKDDAVSRIDQNDQKKGWNDFCLWKFSKEGEPSWPAQFGDGRPGWHIEDTAITEHFFGPQYDIHGGGSDLIFPHHEAELTQMESASEKTPFVKYWVHGGLLYINDERMGKSNKNFFTIDEVLAKYDPRAIRLFMLQGHYRSTLNFSFKLLDSCVNRLLRWIRLADLRWQADQAGEASENDVNEIERIFQNFIHNLENDLDTPNSIAELEKFMDYIELKGVSAPIKSLFDGFMLALDNIFGIDLLSDDISSNIKQLIDERQIARDNSDWQKSDKLRDMLTQKGIQLKDTSKGTIWYRQTV